MLVQKAGKIFFVITTLIVLILGTADWMRGKNAFFVKDIQVEGNQFLTEESLLQRVSIDSTQDLFEVQPDIIEEQIKQHYPLVKNVDVVRQLPGSIRIKVEEARPIAKFYYERECFGLDIEGALLSGLKPSLLYDLPIITGVRLQKQKNGMLRFAAGFSKVIECLQDLQQNNLYLLNDISEIQFNAKSGIILYLLDSAAPVIIGKKDISEKLKKMRLAFPQIKREINFAQTKYIDLRIESQIIIRQL